MMGSGVRSVGVIPKLSILDASRSIRRSLISGGDSPLSSRKVPTPTQLPVLSPLSGRKSTTPTKPPLSSRSKTAGDDDDFQWISSLSWCACFLLVTLMVALVLGIRHLSHDWAAVSLRCSSVPSSSTSPRGSGQSLPSAVELQSQDVSVEEDDDAGDEQEDQKCWSRTRHWKYRPSDRHFPPSPSLARALRNYESLHARCTAGKTWKTLTEMTQSEIKNESCKYLMYVEGWEGLGNRFMSLVTAFTYALMTDRVLLLDTRRNMHGLICEPFQGSSWNLPDTFPFEKVDELPILDDFEDHELERVTAVRLDLRHEQSEKDQRFFCADVQERLDKMAFIGWQSNQYYVPRLYTMPQFWEKLNRLFDDPSVVFTQLSRILLLPQNAVWVKIERIYKAYLAPSKKLVGIQVRSPQFSSFQQSIFDRVAHCVTGDADYIIPRISEEPLALDKGSISEDGTAIFVSSLQREYYEQFKEEYAERGAEDGTLVTVHSMAADGQEKASYDHSVKAFIDMFLLSFSDLLATSGWSTFGYAAQGIGGIYPRIVNTDPKQPESCGRGQSIEPCTHFPFLSTCSATMSNSSQHREWVEKHLRPCQDHHLGIQLVSSSD